MSSMGQGAIERGKYIPELVLIDFENFIKKLGLNYIDYNLLPAMQPDYCIQCKNEKCMQLIRDKIQLLKDKNGKNFFKKNIYLLV